MDEEFLDTVARAYRAISILDELCRDSLEVSLFKILASPEADGDIDMLYKELHGLIAEMFHDALRYARPMEARLEISSGEFVANVQLPPFQTPPDVIIWGQRFFQLKERGPVYRECFAYWVPPEMNVQSP